MQYFKSEFSELLGGILSFSSADALDRSLKSEFMMEIWMEFQSH